MSTRRKLLSISTLIAVLALAALPALAVEPIRKGADLWISVAGSARTSFADEPIPAGFFCADSKPFTGEVVFKGVPLATDPPCALGGVDTVVRRLDDAVFNEKGQATTRIQLMALSLASQQPIETSCGRFDVAAHLTGEQPTTTMKIFASEALGGTYAAPLALNVRLTFTPHEGGQGVRRELARRIDLGPANHSLWVYVNKPQYPVGVKIDTRGDGHPNAVLPASSNFLAGVDPSVLRGEPSRPRFASTPNCVDEASGPPPSCPTGQCPYKACHCAQLADGSPDMSNPYAPNNCPAGHVHCIWACVDPCTAPPGVTVSCPHPVACAIQENPGN